MALKETTTDDFPPEIAEMLGVVPGDLRHALTEQWQGAERKAIFDDACAIILERLMEKGAQA